MAYLGEEIKKLGFGLMRLPQKDGVIDVEQVKEMTDLFLGAGFTYFDTAWAYAGSEDAIRQALVERYPRESYQLATKNAAWINCKTKEEAYAQFDQSLAQTGAGFFDFYLLHNLGENRTGYFDRFDMWNWVQEKKKEGKIRHVGFSFHSTAEELEEILTAHPEMEFVQLQINYADWEEPAVQSRRCYEVARKHGKPVIIMEPVKGGMLATPPKSVEEILKAAEPGSSVASWAIRFAADLEGIITVLSGMSNVEQMKDNLSYMKSFIGFNEQQRETLKTLESFVVAADKFDAVTTSIAKLSEVKENLADSSVKLVEAQTKFISQMSVPERVFEKINAILNRIVTFEESLNALGESIAQTQLLGNSQMNLIQEQITAIQKKTDLAVSYQELADIVTDINRNVVSIVERLSDHVYLYERKEGALRIAA